MSETMVLCYHAVSPTWPAPLSVTPQRFARQMQALVRGGWRAASLEQTILGTSPHRRTLVITFDDAFASVYELAYPVLRRLGLSATLFVPTRHVSEGEPLAWAGTDHWLSTQHRPELRPMDWDQVRTLRRDGWEIGSHTETHPRLPEASDAELDTELTRSRETCSEQLDAPCLTLAYPYGAVDDRVERAADRAGYRAAVRLSSRLGDPRPLRYPRIGIYHTDDRIRFGLKVGRLMRRLRTTRAWDRVR